MNRLQLEKKYVSNYLNSLRPNSERTFSTALNQFYAYAAPRTIVSATQDDVQGFLRELRSRVANDDLPLADETIRGRTSALRSIGSFLVDSQLLDRNPFTIYRRLVPLRHQSQKRPTKLIPFDLVSRMLDAPAANTRQGIRDRALLAILFGGGLRRSEAHNLRLRHVRLDQFGIPYLALPKTKGGKSQRQPLPPWAYEAFARLVSQRRDEGATENSFVFVFYFSDGAARENLQIGSKTLYRWYKKYSADVGIDAAPHSARATAATMLAYNGWSERKIAEFLRHASLSQVQRYIKLANELRHNAGLSLDFHKYPANTDVVLCERFEEFA